MPANQENTTRVGTLGGQPQGQAGDYLSLARFDHVTKHVFILPGLILALALTKPDLSSLIVNIPVGLLSAVCIASSNYVINEWLDRERDAAHPTKSKRRAVVVEMRPGIVYGEYLLLAIGGLLLAAVIGKLFFVTSVLFLISGIVYNVEPIRAKDKPYLDVLTECLNNPIRFLLGWAIVDQVTLPPISVLAAYWMAGAFLMAAKRLGEYRDIAANAGIAVLKRYRRSFEYYTEESLTVSCFVYAMMTAFLLGVFLVKYRVEYILVFPFISGLFAVYLWLATRPGSVVQRPERLFHSRRLDVMLTLTVVVFLFASFVNVPMLDFMAASFLVPISSLQ
ncbi:UbiA family prenyltransferase [Ensifer sp. PDNC004]|uniref:UbiA family prenyltransferase n=1 Tax=Ensifer sp. PDNC004 TaxID=2811423 RepID=UPI001963161E|nr:UbiA family prenyltransferase [Ensifer sp. PDNC004]QRY67981.1 UbiA family prenyltransferase [Ensifer sp. PDNC004]